MSITSEKVLRKMNEIQSKGGPTIGHWHQLRRWLLEDEQVQETFQEAVAKDPDMSAEQKAYWLSQSPAGSYPIKGQVVCQECGTKVDVDDAESVYNSELDDVSFYCKKCTEEAIE